MAIKLDKDKVNAVQDQVDENSYYVDKIVDELVHEYCSDLDNYVASIRARVADKNNPPTNQEIESYLMNLPSLLYFAGGAIETLGVREDMAKAIKTEVYSKKFVESEFKTVGDKKAFAELEAQEEFIVQSAYQRAYKKIKLRLDIATELLASLKKVLSSRMQEMELTRRDR